MGGKVIEFSLVGLLQLGLIMFVMMMSVGLAMIILLKIIVWITWR